MKQIIQDLSKGHTLLEDIPVPMVKKGTVLIKTHRSLVSLGTEKMLVEFGKSSLLAKARQQPDKVLQVLDKIKTESDSDSSIIIECVKKSSPKPKFLDKNKNDSFSK